MEENPDTNFVHIMFHFLNKKKSRKFRQIYNLIKLFILRIAPCYLNWIDWWEIKHLNIQFPEDNKKFELFSKKFEMSTKNCCSVCVIIWFPKQAWYKTTLTALLYKGNRFVFKKYVVLMIVNAHFLEKSDHLDITSRS